MNTTNPKKARTAACGMSIQRETPFKLLILCRSVAARLQACQAALNGAREAITEFHRITGSRVHPILETARRVLRDWVSVGVVYDKSL